jgi:hypothetical protein
VGGFPNAVREYFKYKPALVILYSILTSGAMPGTSRGHM